MSLNRTHFRVAVCDTERDRNYWASREGLDQQTTLGIRRADILLVPWENRGKGALTFPTETSEFYQSLARRLGEGRVAIAVNSGDYAELSLHADEKRWPTMLVSTVMLTIVANVLGDEIERLLHDSTPTSSIELQVIIENERGKCISIDYKGPPNRLVNTILAEANRCFPQPTADLDDLRRAIPD